MNGLSDCQCVSENNIEPINEFVCRAVRRLSNKDNYRQTIYKVVRVGERKYRIEARARWYRYFLFGKEKNKINFNIEEIEDE